jgi:hypothetical protein
LAVVGRSADHALDISEVVETVAVGWGTGALQEGNQLFIEFGTDGGRVRRSFGIVFFVWPLSARALPEYDSRGIPVDIRTPGSERHRGHIQRDISSRATARAALSSSPRRNAGIDEY